MTVKGTNLASQLKTTGQPKPVEKMKKVVDSKMIELLKQPSSELARLSKKNIKAALESSKFEPKIVDKKGPSPPSDLYLFKGITLAAHLNRVSTLPRDYDFYSNLNDPRRRERLTPAHY